MSPGCIFEKNGSGDTIFLRPATPRNLQELPIHLRDSAGRNVKIPCPCSVGQALQCICPSCKNTVFFLASENYLHCNCGIYKPADAIFKCFDQAHGDDYLEYRNTETLSSLLNELKKSDHYNVLILGAPGVGKSTFINAFINHVLFDSLQDAIEAPGFHWAIPSYFSYSGMIDKEWKTITVDIGKSSQHETISTNGSSAPQTYVSYVLNVDGLTIRLIDTPALSDTRGPREDKEHIRHLGRILKSFDDISTVLLLLKPNQSRLTVSFDYETTELLSQLHKETRTNIAFGFVNARSTDFSLGEIGPLLQGLLNREKTEIQLSYDNTFFFDSESFRYLAAYKVNGQKMSDIDRYEESFKKSAEESRRLIKSTTGKTLHKVKKTLCLRKVRSYIDQVMHAIEKLSALTQDNQSRLEEEESRFQELRSEKLALQLRLETTVTKMVKKELPSPRLACCHQECTRIEGEEHGNLLAIHKTCHENCLDVNSTDASDGTVGAPGISNCQVFRGPGGLCGSCGHEWKCHYRRTYDMTFEKARIEDPALTEHYKRNISLRADAEVAIQSWQNQLKELKGCRAIVNKVLASLIAYLRGNALVDYNRTIPSYLDYIAQEASRYGDEEATTRLRAQSLEYEHWLDRIVCTEKELELPGFVPTDADISRLITTHGKIKAGGYDIIDLTVMQEDA